MLLHLIEILLLITIALKLGIQFETPKNNWELLAYCLIIIFILLFEHWFYNDVDYEKIRRIINEELDKKEIK